MKQPAEAVHPYLGSSGWLKSRELKVPVDGDSRPVHWYTYPMFARRISPDMYLGRREFRQLQFVGLRTMSPVTRETSAFYRDRNCLGV